MAGIPPFEEAISSYRDFLRLRGLPEHPVWVFRDDVASKRGRLAIRVPLPESNGEAARKMYEAARRSGLGVALVAIGRLGASVTCYVSVPRDQDEAEALLFSPESLKMSVPTELPSAVEVHGGVRWLFRVWLGRKWAEVPRRPM